METLPRHHKRRRHQGTVLRECWVFTNGRTTVNETTVVSKASVVRYKIDQLGRLFNLVHKKIEMGVVRYRSAKAALTSTSPPQGLSREPITPQLLKIANLTIHHSMEVVRYPSMKAALTGTLPPQGLRRQLITPRLLKIANLTIHHSIWIATPRILLAQEPRHLRRMVSEVVFCC